MKKLIALVLTVLLIPSAAFAVDLSAMSFDELVALREQIDLAIWQSEDWQEVTVPQGVWQVGVDIPAGHWTIRAHDGAYTSIKYGPSLDVTGYDISIFDCIISDYVKSPKRSTYDKGDDRLTIDIDAKDGFYIVISNGDAVFTPYTGKPSLGFKFK